MKPLQLYYQERGVIIVGSPWCLRCPELGDSNVPSFCAMLGCEREVPCGAVREIVVANMEETGPGVTWSMREAGDIKDESGCAGSVLLGTGAWIDDEGMLGKTPRYSGSRGSLDRGAKS